MIRDERDEGKLYTHAEVVELQREQEQELTPESILIGLNKIIFGPKD